MTTPLISDSQFLDQLQSTRLPPGAFDHAGHVRAAWLCFRQDPADAGERFVAMLKRYAACLGQPGKYHDTVTRALLLLIEHRMQDAPDGEDWDGFQHRNDDLMTDAIAVLTRHYSRERLFSDAARKAYLEPDREPLPGRALA